MSVFRIIGSDGKPYGPVSPEQLRQWIREGRINKYTQVQPESGADWTPLSSLPEFAAEFAGMTSSPPLLPQSTGETPRGGGPVDPDAMAQEILSRNPRIRIGACFSRGWNLICENIWLSLGVGFVAMMLTNVPLLAGPAYAGIVWFFLKRIRREPAKFEDLFAPFNVAFVPTLLAGLVVSLLATVGFALCIIPGIVLIAIWMFTWPLLMDKRLEFWPAMEVSRKVLWPNVWAAMGLLFMGFMVMILGLLCCYVGVFFAFPWLIAAEAYAYEDFFGHQQEPHSTTTPRQVLNFSSEPYKNV